MKHKLHFLCVSLFIATMAFSCVAMINVARSSMEREKSPSISDESYKAQIDGNTEFALDLFAKIKDKPNNLFFSPFSISTALAMTYAGAKNETEKEMAEVLKFIEPKSDTHKAFNKLDLSLKQQMAKSKEGESEFKLNVVNSIWAQAGYAWRPEFLDSMMVNYGAGIFQTDFVKDTKKSRLDINKWVENETRNKIKNLIKPGVLDNMTRMALVNAIYFYGEWRNQFQGGLTRDGIFNRLDASKVTVPLMHQTKGFKYYRNEMLEALEMDYRDCEISMLVLLPPIEKFEEMQETLDTELLNEIIAGLDYQEVILTFPKVKMEAEFELSDTLSSMGMPTPFSMKADFSGMDGTLQLFIRKVIHKAFVAIDEKGTEAAATTSVVTALKSTLMSEPIRFTADHPFVFLIRDKQTNSLLFIGRVMDPS